MRGSGHKATGPSAALFSALWISWMPPTASSAEYTPLLPAMIAALTTTTAPDWLEPPFLPHRTLTHWPPIWLILPYAIGSFLHTTHLSPTAQALLTSLSFGFSAGCLMHILTDAPNPMGIPWILPWKRWSPKWWKSGQYEITQVIALTTIALLLCKQYPPNWHHLLP